MKINVSGFQWETDAFTRQTSEAENPAANSSWAGIEWKWVSLLSSKNSSRVTDHWWNDEVLIENGFEIMLAFLFEERWALSWEVHRHKSATIYTYYLLCEMHLYCKLCPPNPDGHKLLETRDIAVLVCTRATFFVMFKWQPRMDGIDRTVTSTFGQHYIQSRGEATVDLRTLWIKEWKERVWGQKLLWRSGWMTWRSQDLYFWTTIANGELIFVTCIRSIHHVTTMCQLLK